MSNWLRRIGFERRPYDFASTHDISDLRGKTVRGGAVTAIGQVAKGLLHLTHTVVLARLLEPEDFGIVAMSLAVTGFIVMFRELGLPMATVQVPVLSRQQVNSMFWINLLASILLGLITVATAPLVARLYDDPRLVAVLAFSGACFVVGGMSVQHLALMRRQLRFKAITSLQVAGMVLTTVTAVGLGFLDFGYWSLVISPVAGATFVMLGAWWMSGWTPGLPSFSGAGVGQMLLFGGNLTLANILTYWSKNLDNVLVGWYWGAAPLGLYSKGYGLMLMPAQHLGRPLAGVVIPSLSRLQDDPDRLARFLYRGTHLMAAVMLPVIVALAIFAEPLVSLLLGEKWLTAAHIFQVLAVVSLCQPLINASNWLFLATGRSDRMLKFSVMQTLLIAIGFAITLPMGIWYVALTHAIVNVGTLIPRLLYAAKGTQVTLGGLWEAVRAPVLASMTCGAACVGVVLTRADTMNPAVALFGVALGAVVYLLTLYLLGDLNRIVALARDLKPATKPKAVAA